MRHEVLRQVSGLAVIGLSVCLVRDVGASEAVERHARAAAADVARAEAISVRATRTYAAVRELFGRRHASAEELAIAKRDASVAKAARNAAAVWNATLVQESNAEAFESVGLSNATKNKLHAAINAGRFDVLPLWRGYLATIVGAAIASMDEQVASDRVSRFTSVPSFARRAGEEAALAEQLAVAQQNAAAAKAEVMDARETLLAVLAEDDASERRLDADWEPVAFLNPYDLLFVPEGGVIVAHRRPSYIAASKERFETRSRIEAVPVFEPTPADRARPSQATTRFPGRTYSSGYAFGEVRRNLPADMRFPRADGLGGPWYLPGSPTNELRFRRRLSNDGQ